MRKEDMHSPEVKRLLNGRLPFVTRYGITIVAAVMVLVGAAWAASGGPAQQLLRNMVKHTIEEIKNKI